MYNKVKRALELTAAIVGIVAGVTALISGIVGIATSYVNNWYAYTEVYYIPGIICGVVNAIIGIVIIILSALCIKRPKMIYDEALGREVYAKRKGVNITLVIFLGVLLITGGLACVTMSIATIIASSATLFFVVSTLGVKIPAMCLRPIMVEKKEKTCANNKENVNMNKKENSVESKIEELKHLKSLYVINDEQYEYAITCIIKEMATDKE